MGEIANDIITGYCCSLCGVYFEEAHNHPVVCKDCWKQLSIAERENYILAYHKEL